MGEDQRCTDCELAFAYRDDRVKDASNAVAVAAGALGLVAAGVLATPVALVAPLAAVVTAKAAGALTRFFSRRRFLREGRGTRQGLFDGTQIAAGPSPRDAARVPRPRITRGRRTVDHVRYRQAGLYGS